MIFPRFLRTLPILLAAAVGGGSLNAAPVRPVDDAQVLERLPSRAGDPRTAQRQAWRAALRAQPDDVDTAVALAQSHIDELLQSGDARHAGMAQAALRRWWQQAEPPLEVRVLRAVLRQFDHDFEPALADLRAVVAEEPDHVQAWAWMAAVSMVIARYDDAAKACQAMAPHTTALTAQACSASVLAATGSAAQAATQLQRALQAAPQADADERLWALTRLAETQERLGRAAEAEAAYKQALSLSLEDNYLRAAYADFLLDQNRPREVLVLLEKAPRNDTVLLRLALAAKAAGDAGAPRWREAMASRISAANARGDSKHRKEEARFVLSVLGNAASALPLAQQNFAQQQELSDAMLLLDAALAARQPAAAEPALRWAARSRAEHPRLRERVRALEALK